jgi:maltose alpha-D-glucosyltransferase/alpha-amylase
MWMERAIRTRKEWPELGWGDWRVLGTRNASVMAHMTTWGAGCALALHNFADLPARATVRLPADAGDGRWRHIFGPRDGGAAVPEDGRLTLELPAYGYAWFGRRSLP